MADQLSPEMLARLKAMRQPSSSGYMGPTQFNEGGLNYAAMYGGLNGSAEDNVGQIGNFQGYAVGSQNSKPGDLFNVYNEDGSFRGQAKDQGDQATKNLLMFLGAAGGLAAFAPGGFLNAGSGATAATATPGQIGVGGINPGLGSGTLDLGLGSITDAGISGSMFTTPTVAAPLPMTQGGWLAATGAPVGTIGAPTMAAGLGAGTGAALGTSAAAGTSAGGTNTAATTAGSSFLPQSASEWAKLGVTGLSALAGSQGQKGEQTTQSRMDPRMDPYVYGEGGILEAARRKMQEQMAPGYLKGYDDMRSIGQGLLSAPVAGNGYSLFGRK